MKTKMPAKPATHPLARKPVGACVLLALLFAVPLGAGRASVLSGHVPEIASHLQPVGRLAASNRMDFAIGLPLRNRAALTNLLQQLYDPSSTNFHRYLTPDQFADAFGPTEAAYQTVLRFAATNGLTVTTVYSHRELVGVSAPVPAIEKAFHIQLLTYQHPAQHREFFAPDVEPSVDASVPIQSISGLNNLDQVDPGLRRQTTTNSGPANGTGPNGTSFQGKDFRVAYAPGVTLNGTGQNVGLVELDGYFPNDITTYERQAGLPSVPLTIIPLAGSAGFPDKNTNRVAEVSLDIEMVISMAPGLKNLYVFEGSNFDTILGSLVTNTQINQFSSSWVGFGFDATGDGFLVHPQSLYLDSCNPKSLRMKNSSSR